MNNNNGTLIDERNTTYKEKRQRPYRKIGFVKMEVDLMVEALNVLLANYQVHYQKLRNYHWNVVGSDFFDIHEQFEIQYNEARENIDEIAERIRVFGRRPMSTLQGYLDFSDIKETLTELSSQDMVNDILNDYQILLEKMVAVVDVAIDNGDLGTEDIIKTYIKSLEKYHWMMTAFNTKK